MSVGSITTEIAKAKRKTNKNSDDVLIDDGEEFGTVWLENPEPWKTLKKPVGDDT